MAQYILSAFADEAGSSLDEQLTAIAAEGISLIELRGVDGKSCAALSEAEAEAVARKLAAHGVGLSALGSPYGKAAIDQPFEEHLAAFRHGLRLCGALGCPRLRMFSFFMPKEGRPEAWRDEVLRRLEIMLEDAEKAGVQLVHENEKGIYGDTDVRCEELLEHFEGRLGFAFDPANFIQCGVKPLEAYARLHGRITYMHIKDALLADGAVVRAGHGDGHVPELLARLSAERQGEIILTVEPHLTVFDGLSGLQDEEVLHHERYASRQEAFHAACQALRDILAGL